MNSIMLSIIFVITFGGAYAQDSYVNVNDGRLRGRIRRVDNVDVEQYLGIPFAAPPVGKLRFGRPVPPEKWDGVRDATWYGAACPQNNLRQKFNITMDEDCLNLDVYTPVTKPSSLMSVLVYVHGGAFEVGSGAFIDPSIIATKNVVMVSIDYRLNALGFLSLGDAAAPGNYGMLDQVMALEWVRDNIASFGGNPNDVTIMGYSAGGASVSLHMLSPLSRGLFHKVIELSGSSLAPWAAAMTTDSFSPKDVALDLARKVNCSMVNSDAILACLRRVDVTDILRNSKPVDLPPFFLTWSPVVETYFNFLPDTPREIIERGGSANVPILMGINKDENANFVGKIEGSENGVTAKEMRDQISFFSTRYPGHTLDVRDAIEERYLHSIDYTDPIAIRGSLIKLVTDSIFTAPAVLEAELLSRHQPVYFYQLAHRSDSDTSPEWQGVLHSRGLNVYAFGVPIAAAQENFSKWNWVWTDEDKIFSRHVIEMTTQFAKSGNPTSTPVNGFTWKPFDVSEKKYVHLDLQPKMLSDLRPKDMAFWNEVLPELLAEDKGFPVSGSTSTEHPKLFILIFVCTIGTLANM